MRRLTVFCLAAMALAAGGFVMAQAGGGKAGVEVVGLRMMKDLPEAMRDLVMENGGTTMTLLVSQADRFIIGLDEKACELATFADDKQTDLRPKEPGFMGKPGWLGPFSPKISDDGHHCSVQLVSDRTPASGAARIAVKGKLVLLCGAGEKTAEQKDLDLKDGSKLTAGPVPMTIGDVGDSEYGDMKMQFELKFEQDDSAIKEMVFLDAAGNEIEHEYMGSSSFGFGDKKSYTRTMGLAKKVASVTVKVTYFEKIEPLEVPLDLAVGVGF